MRLNLLGVRHNRLTMYALILVAVFSKEGKVAEPETAGKRSRDSYQGVQIGSAPPTRPVVAADWKPSPDVRITIRISKGSLRSFYDEIARQAKIHFNFVPGFEHCVVTAFVRNLTVREALQLTLSIRGMTYQQAGRSDTYTIAPRGGTRVCPRLQPTRKAKGSCTATKGLPISLNCSDGSISAFAEIVFDQSHGSFFFGNGAENYPITTQLVGATLDHAANEINLDDSLTVEQLATSKVYLISPNKP